MLMYASERQTYISICKNLEMTSKNMPPSRCKQGITLSILNLEIELNSHYTAAIITAAITKLSICFILYMNG